MGAGCAHLQGQNGIQDIVVTKRFLQKTGGSSCCCGEREDALHVIVVVDDAASRRQADLHSLETTINAEGRGERVTVVQADGGADWAPCGTAPSASASASGSASTAVGSSSSSAATPCSVAGPAAESSPVSTVAAAPAAESGAGTGRQTLGVREGLKTEPRQSSVGVTPVRSSSFSENGSISNSGSVRPYTARKAESGKKSAFRSENSNGMFRQNSGISYKSGSLKKKLSTIFWNRNNENKGLNRLQTSNTNRPQDYAWMEDVIDHLVRNEANTLGCQDMATGKLFTPLFFVAGMCPSVFAGMQAVMYSVNGDREVDFWWVKPAKGEAASLERSTLSRHAKGPYKNDPGRSKPFFKPFADYFCLATNAQSAPGLHFGIEGGTPAPRAYMDKVGEDVSGRPDRMYLHFVWQEDWSPIWARTKYLRGKLVYQKEPGAPEFFARQFEVQNGVMIVPRHHVEERVRSALPGDEIKELFELSAAHFTAAPQ